jgi:hypothetical protein
VDGNYGHHISPLYQTLLWKLFGQMNGALLFAAFGDLNKQIQKLIITSGVNG